MIEFGELRYKNLLSSGNAFTVLDLSAAPTTLIVGKNGSGKSTMLDALSFALFGKPFRNINKPQLVSSINKGDLVVGLEFSVRGDSYLIRRGLKPVIFEIWKNGKMVDHDAKAKDYQTVLEDQILRMDYKTFGQIVVLGSSTFVPFMQLNANHRRQVIEELLDIQIFSIMNNIVRARLDENKSKTRDVKGDIDLSKNKIGMTKQHTKELRIIQENRVTEIRVEAIEIYKKFELVQEEIRTHLAKISGLSKYESQASEISSKLSDLNHAKTDILYDMTNHEKLLSFFRDTHVCGTCHQDIEDDIRDTQISLHQDKIGVCNALITKNDNARIDLEYSLIEVKKFLSKIISLEALITTLQFKEKSYKTTLNTLRGEMEAATKQVSEITGQEMDTLENELRDLIGKSRVLSGDADVLRVAASLLKDSGIKSKIIQQYVPIINNLVNKYLDDMEFFVQFELDDQFNETIKSRFRDVFSYNSFSEGEKARIDLALMFTWRQIAKMRSTNSTNILILDEVFDGSLDGEGTDALTDILSIAGRDSNIIVISHKGEKIQDKFDRILRVEKVRNFSILSEE